MEWTNNLIELNKKQNGIDKETLKTISILIAPFAPHIGEELYHMLGGKQSVFFAKWPICDEKYLKSKIIKIPIQVNGKTKSFIDVDIDLDDENVKKLAKENIKNKLDGEIVKEIYIKGKIINFVVK